VESEWRWNVFDYGLQGSEYRLIARVSGSPSVILIAAKAVGATTYDVLFVPVPGQLPVLLSTVAIPGANPHFPYGLAVLPD